MRKSQLTPDMLERIIDIAEKASQQHLIPNVVRAAARPFPRPPPVLAVEGGRRVAHCCALWLTRARSLPLLPSGRAGQPGLPLHLHERHHHHPGRAQLLAAEAGALGEAAHARVLAADADQRPQPAPRIQAAGSGARRATAPPRLGGHADAPLSVAQNVRRTRRSRKNDMNSLQRLQQLRDETQQLEELLKLAYERECLKRRAVEHQEEIFYQVMHDLTERKRPRQLQIKLHQVRAAPRWSEAGAAADSPNHPSAAAAHAHLLPPHCPLLADAPAGHGRRGRGQERGGGRGRRRRAAGPVAQAAAQARGPVGRCGPLDRGGARVGRGGRRGAGADGRQDGGAPAAAGLVRRHSGRRRLQADAAAAAQPGQGAPHPHQALHGRRPALLSQRAGRQLQLDAAQAAPGRRRLLRHVRRAGGPHGARHRTLLSPSRGRARPVWAAARRLAPGAALRHLRTAPAPGRPPARRRRRGGSATQGHAGVPMVRAPPPAYPLASAF